MNKKFLFAFLLITPINTFGSSINNTTITELHTNLNFPNLVFIQVNPKPLDKPACSSSDDYDYIVDVGASDAGKTIYSMLLSAYSAQKLVEIFGYDRCNIKNGYEDLKSISSK